MIVPLLRSTMRTKFCRMPWRLNIAQGLIGVKARSGSKCRTAAETKTGRQCQTRNPVKSHDEILPATHPRTPGSRGSANDANPLSFLPAAEIGSKCGTASGNLMRPKDFCPKTSGRQEHHECTCPAGNNGHSVNAGCVAQRGMEVGGRCRIIPSDAPRRCLFDFRAGPKESEAILCPPFSRVPHSPCHLVLRSLRACSVSGQ